MATGADRILANLPPTFAPLPRPTALAALADAYGGELAKAENMLAAVMFAHWVDYADTDADDLTDLPLIAALYGLAPRDDETIEGFRAHLKRYIRTFIEGTVTVRGIFRVVAEALGLVIADDYTQLDTWWNRRSGPLLATVEAAADDAAALLFGIAGASVRGVPARAAQFVGTPDLTQPVDLRGHSILRLAIDGGPVTTFDLAIHLAAAGQADIAAIVAALAALPGVAAEARAGRLVLRSASAGAASTLELADDPADATPALLGIAPHTYWGSDAVSARVLGSIDLPASLDLTTRRYLRLIIDAKAAHEIDCAGPNPAATTPQQILAAINAGTGAAVASLVGSRLALTTPTVGLTGTIELRVPTAGDAAPLLLGDAERYARGRDAAAARVSGLVNLGAGIDLSQRANLQLALDAFAPMIVNCAGADPHKTLAGEIAAAINAAVGVPVATQNGRTVTLTSQQVGPSAKIRLLHAPASDALDLIFGFGPRRATGADAAPARLEGLPLPAAGVDLRALQRLSVAVDDGAPTVVDLAKAGLARSDVKPDEIVNAINKAAGQDVASTDGTRLTLASAGSGAEASIALLPIETRRVRPFVSRAFSVDEASKAVLGLFAGSADGTHATAGSLSGNVDVHDGVDLRPSRFLRISVDGGPTRDVDCARFSPRPYAALLHEITKAIDQTCGIDGLASVNDDHLVLTSPNAGRTSGVALLPNAGDGARIIFGVDQATATGTAAQHLVFLGLADLANGVDLSAADRVKLAIDGGNAMEIACAGGNPAHTSAAEIASQINAALGGSYASSDGAHVRLASSAAGSASSIAFLTPSQRDATRTIFGVDPPRTYQAADAAPAVLASAHDLPTALDLSAAPFVRLAVDGGAPVLIDCRGADPAHTSPAEVAAGIAAAIPAAVASATVQGARVVITAASTGPASRIALQPAGDGDATGLLFGTPTTTPGSDPQPAQLRGTIDLRLPVDLSRRSVVRLAFDGARATDVDVSGAAPDRTFGDEIVAAVNAAFPGTAALDDSGHLVLTSTLPGESSRIEVQPLRPIEVIEYPPAKASMGPVQVSTGGRLRLVNDGAADAVAAFTFAGGTGLCGLDLIGLTTGFRIHLDAAIVGNEQLSVSAGLDGGIEAAILRADGSKQILAREQVVATPSAVAATVPFDGTRNLCTGMPGSRASLALVDPIARNVVVLESTAAPGQTAVSVQCMPANPVQASAVPSGPSRPLELLGIVLGKGATGTLVDGNGSKIADLRANAGASLADFAGAMVLASGTWFGDDKVPVLAVDTLARIFDIEVAGTAFAGTALDSRAGARSLAARLAEAGTGVLARDVLPAEALRLPRGASDWLLVRCAGSRFDADWFEKAHFAGGPCNAAGVFDVSRFNAAADASAASDPSAGELTRYGPIAEGDPVAVTVTWQAHRGGAFTVNLPADLPDLFGARFNAARFASPDAQPETYDGVVLDPPSDPQFVKTILAKSALVRAEAVATVPLGWEAQTVPFVQPRRRFLSGGRADRPSAIYLRQHGVGGAIGIFARDNGAWGDEISLTVRYGGPAIFDLTVAHAAARFENARAIAFAGRILAAGESALPNPVGATLKPGPVGVAQAKAAGIRAVVTRERS